MCGKKTLKGHITLLAAAYMNVTEKRKLLVIGKSKNPVSFQNIKQLTVTYKVNKSVWMTTHFFKEF